jgi:lysylphosphatidylglycerol synthetase-like protein (DUF2156 family)
VLAGLRQPSVQLLFGLAGLALLSAAWSTVDVGTALRWGLVVGGYGSMALVGGVLLRRWGPASVAGIVAAAAGLAGAIGLWAVAWRELPNAQWLEGTWRPGGPFEYPNTLALLQVAALLPLARASLARDRAVATSACLGIGVAAAVLALAGSAVAVLFALAIAMATIVWPRALLASSRRDVVAVWAAAALIALLAHAVAGHPSHRFDTAGGAARLAGLAIAVLVTPIAIGLARRLAGRASLVPLAALAVALAVLAAAALPRLTFAGDLDGRAELARASIETSLDNPVLGAGTGAFGVASFVHQGDTRDNSVFAHDLPLELWAELGPLGLALVVALYVVVARLLRATAGLPGAALLAPCVATFLLSNLIDWSWHQPAMAAMWALCLGGLTAIRTCRPIGVSL